MSRGIKLDLFVGASIEDGWHKIEDEKPSQQKGILPPQEHSLVIKKAKRSSKVVTEVGEFFLAQGELEKLLSTLKKTLGCGGTLKDGVLELQGAIEEKTTERLKILGYGFKKRKN